MVGNFGNVFFGKKVIVTGNTGFKGAWLSIWLLNLGAKVVGISKDVPTDPSIFISHNLRSKIKHFETDVRDLSALVDIFKVERPDFVFHLAAQPIVSASYIDPLETMTSNVIGTANVLECLRVTNHSCSAVMITSDKCYDNVEWTWGYRENDALGGKDPYSASKGAAELMIKTFFYSYFSKPESLVRVASVRAGNVIGGGDWAINRIVPDCIRAWTKNEAVKLRHPHATRPWQHVLEPLSGYLRTAQRLTQEKNINGEAYNFGPDSGQTNTVLELLTAIQSFWDKQRNNFILNNEDNFHEAGLLKLNCDKALHDLKWIPVLNFMQAAEFTSKWYREFYNGTKDDMFEFTSDQINQYVKLASQKRLEWTT